MESKPNAFDFSGYRNYQEETEAFVRKEADARAAGRDRDAWDLAAERMKDLPNHMSGDEIREAERLFLKREAESRRRSAEDANNPRPPSPQELAQAAYDAACKNIKPEAHEMSDAERKTQMDIEAMYEEQRIRKIATDLASRKATNYYQR